MQVGEAVVMAASGGPEGAQEVDFKAVCPAANCERLNLVVGAWRAAVALDRPKRGALRHFRVRVPADLRFQPGDKVGVEFFYPGEQAGAR